MVPLSVVASTISFRVPWLVSTYLQRQGACVRPACGSTCNWTQAAQGVVPLLAQGEVWQHSLAVCSLTACLSEGTVQQSQVLVELA